MSPDLQQQLSQRLSAHHVQQLTRKRIVFPQNMLNFTKNDYLSLANQSVISNKHSLGACGSPVIHYTDIHQALEQRIAKWQAYPRALLFTSGYLAVMGTITALVGKHDFVAVDKQCHASVFDGIQLCKATWQRYADNDYQRLENILQQHNKGLRFIITSSVFSMQGHLADLNVLTHIANKYNATLIIDDVHATGVLGPNGQGAVAHFGLSQQTPLMIGSLTKGLGTLGAFVAGNEFMIEAIMQFARPYMFSATLPTSLATASMNAIDTVEQAHDARAHLQSLIAYFQQQAKNKGLHILPSNTPIQAIIFPDIDSLQQQTKRLFEKNILVSAIRPPTVPKESPRMRLTLTAAHQREEIDRLLMEL